jgi:opacity protein-like surface antigen
METIHKINSKIIKIKSMKNIAFRIVALFFIAFLIVVKTSAQYNNPLRRGEFGIRYMPTFSSIDLKASNDDVVRGSVSINNGFGIMVGVNLSKHIGFQGEVNYYQISQSFRDLDLDNKVNIKYFNVPLLLSFNTNKEMRINFNVVAGPQFGVNAGSNIKTTGTAHPEDLHAVVAVKKGDVGFAYGAGLEIAINRNHTFRLDLGYRGFYGLVNINATSTENNTYNVIAKASRKTNAMYAGLTLLF